MWIILILYLIGVWLTAVWIYPLVMGDRPWDLQRVTWTIMWFPFWAYWGVSLLISIARLIRKLW